MDNLYCVAHIIPRRCENSFLWITKDYKINHNKSLKVLLFITKEMNKPIELMNREFPCKGLASILEVKQKSLQHGSDPNSLCSIQSGE